MPIAFEDLSSNLLAQVDVVVVDLRFAEPLHDLKLNVACIATFAEPMLSCHEKASSCQPWIGESMT